MANYHVLVNNASTGPFTEDQIREQLAAGQITGDTMVWREGTADWVKLSTVDLDKPKLTLRSAAATTMPPPLAAAPAAAAPLQFDQAEFAQVTDKKVTCAACKQPVTDVYFEVNGQIACRRCHDALQASRTGGSGAARFLRATVAGSCVAAVGSGIWFAIAKLANMELGIIAIAVGFGVGYAVRWGSNARGGWLYQLLAIFLTYCSIVTAYIPFIIEGLRDHDREEHAQAGTNSVTNATADKPPTGEKEHPRMTVAKAIIGFAVIFAIAFLSPFLQGISNVIGWIIIGIALYEAWKLNKRFPVIINGPFRVGQPGAPA